MKTINLKILGNAVSVSSNNIPFLNFVEKYFSGFSVEKAAASNNINLQFNFQPGFSYKLNGQRLKDLDIYWGENYGTDLKNNDFHFCYHETTTRLNLNETTWRGEINFQKNIFKHLANRLFFKGGLTNIHYYRLLTRLIIQNLIFLKTRQSQDLTIISGAGLVINNKAYIFAGLPGSGKSTLIKNLKTKYPESEILSENYLPIINNQVYYFTEGRELNKQNSCPLAQIHVIGHGREHSNRLLSPEEAANKLEAINIFTAELPEQGPLLNYLLQANGAGKLFSTKINDVATVPCYLSVIDKDALNFLESFAKNL